MGSKKTKTTSQETATTSPVVPSFYSSPVANYYNNVVNPLVSNKPSVVTPANSLQNSVYNSAQSLGSPDLSQATNAVRGLLGGGTTTSGGVTLSGFGAPAQGPNLQAQQAGLSLAQLAQAPQAQQAGVTTAGYNTAATPGAVPVAGVGWVDPLQVARAELAELPEAVRANAIGVGPSLGAVASEINLEKLQRAQAASLLSNFDAYLNPATDAYVTNSLAGFDNDAGRREAAYQAQAAKSGAFGGSRFAIGEAALSADLARERAALESGLHYTAFNNAADLSDRDSNRRQEAAQFNAAQFNNALGTNAQLGTQANIANANNSSQQAIASAGFANNAELANAAAANQFGLAVFNASNLNNQFNAGQMNDALAQVYGFDTAAAMQNAQAQNSANQLQYTTGANVGMFNAGQANDANQFNVGQANQIGMYNTGQANDLAQFNTGQANTLGQFNAGQANQNSQFNANSANDMAQFAANYGLAQGNQLLNAAGLLGDLAASQNTMNLNNLGFQNTVGNQQWQQQNMQTLAPYTQAQLIQGLLDPSIANLFTGQTINTNGTSTSKQSGGLLESLLGGAFSLGSAYLGR